MPELSQPGSRRSRVSTPDAELSGGAKERQALLSQLQGNLDLPSPPMVVLRVIEQASQPNCDVSDLARVLQQDPALCGKLLRTVNSVLYALPHPVTSLERAVTFLGLNPLRSLVLSLSLPSVKFNQFPRELVQNYWKLSVCGALVARELSARLGREMAETDLVTGLLRDLGILVLHHLRPHLYSRILTLPAEQFATRQCELEEEMFGLDHAEAGAYLLNSWKMPEEITEVVRYHHAHDGPWRLPEHLQDRARVVYFATQVAQLQLDPGNTLLVETLLTTARSSFGMDPIELQAFLQPVKAKAEAFAAVMNVDIGACIPFEAILSKGAEELIRLTVQSSLEQAAQMRPWEAPSGDAFGAPAARSRAGISGMSQPLGELSRTGLVRPPALVSQSQAGGQMSQGLTGAHGNACEQIQEHSSSTSLLVHALLGPPREARDLGSLGSFRVLDLLGHGGMGVVFKAIDPALGRLVAIKTLLPHFADCARARRRFTREAQAAAAIVHENVVNVHSVGQVKNIPYIVMEYVPGCSLQQKLDEKGQFQLYEAISVIKQVAAGLASAHELRLVHRDIKPANILLVRGGPLVKITDFGLARAIDAVAETNSGEMVGTPQYMSPEQALGVEIDHRSDLYSLGTMFYRLATGRLPFMDDNVIRMLHKICDTDPPPVRSLNPDVPGWLARLIEQMLAKSPDYRPESAVEIFDKLEKYGDEVLPNPALNPKERPSRPSRHGGIH